MLNNDILHIVSAEVAGDHRLRLEFDDHTGRDHGRGKEIPDVPSGTGQAGERGRKRGRDTSPYLWKGARLGRPFGTRMAATTIRGGIPT